MKILWLINVVLPEASALMNQESSPLGGWLINASREISNKENIELSIIFPKNDIKEYQKLNGENITYYAFKAVNDRDKNLIEHNPTLEKIINQVNPDIVHIYGTEIAHTLSMVNVCKKNQIKTIISIQGLVSVISKHTYADLPWKVIHGFTLRNIMLKDSVAGLKKLYIKRGKNEIAAVKKVDHIIGRTTWDKACTSQMNPSAKYHFCNETLREEFYKDQWNINKCEKHSIFISQAQNPIKGLHYILEAMPSILSRYPDAKLYVGGKNIIKSETYKEKLKMTYYSKYIRSMIKKLNLNDKIIFTGLLNEKDMCERYLKSHVFICPSSIENSPNALGEAMILGVPCVASDVGGIVDMLKHNEEGYVYQSDAPYMMAHYICEIFKNEDLTLKLSKNARAHAMRTHDKDINTQRLMKIYEELVSSE